MPEKRKEFTMRCGQEDGGMQSKYVMIYARSF